MLKDGLVRAEGGRAELVGGRTPIDACAVLADNEEVGGPEEKIEPLGIANCECCSWEVLEEAEWISGADTA